jgi:predicted NBD/HSP70 family sugar kinase
VPEQPRAGLGLPVLVESAVNTLVVAERRYGTGRRHDDFLSATICFGVGAAIANGGTVFRGAHGDADEFGDTSTDSNAPGACAAIAAAWRR